MSTLKHMPLTKPKMLLGTTIPHSFSTLTLLNFTTKPFFPKSIHYHRHYNSSATATTAVAPSSPHPWPEWISFVDRLMSRGYLSENNDGDSDGNLVYRELKLLKEPCCDFARDRFDVFRSLPKDDIKNIVEVGCPKLVRKVVNSAKRLRVYVGLEEKNVCDACSLRGSCDRAYLKPNGSESVRTVDIMRLLLFYALDPTVISEAVRPTGIEVAESSARRLLSMLMELTEASQEPAFTQTPNTKEKFVNSTVTVPSEATERWKGEWVCPKCSFLNYSRNTRCRKCIEDAPKKQDSVEPKKGDWNCPQCKFLNYAKNIRCRQCNEDAPKKREIEHVKLKKGDWHCPQCNFLNYTGNTQCRKCNEGAPEKRESRRVEPKKGDWDCTQCAFINFASRTNCLQCTATRPPQSLNTGEWVCSTCSFLNFRRNAACLKCDTKQVQEGAFLTNYIWRKPTPSAIT